MVLTSKDANLTKAHARYLESRFITLALQTNRAKLLNSTNPSAVVLPEADTSDMEYFIDQAKIVLPVLSVNIFRSASTQAVATVDSARAVPASPTFELKSKKDEFFATAKEVDGEFTVLAGSTARDHWVGVPVHNYTGLRQKLEHDGILVPQPNGLAMEFTHDQVFASPSAAAAIVLGRSANGRTEWITQDSRLTYGEWQRQSVERAAQEVDLVDIQGTAADTNAS